jgi:hypothetical protein
VINPFRVCLYVLRVVLFVAYCTVSVDCTLTSAMHAQHNNTPQCLSSDDLAIHDHVSPLHAAGAYSKHTVDVNKVISKSKCNMCQSIVIMLCSVMSGVLDAPLL